MPLAGLVNETQVMRQEEPGLGGPLGITATLRKILNIPFEATATSDWPGQVGLEAARYCETPAFECNPPALIHHRLVLFGRPPEELDLLYEGVKRNVPPPAGSISLMPAGSTARVRSSGWKDELHIFLERVGRAGRCRGIRPRSGAADGPAAGRPGPAATAGRDGSGGRRAEGR